MSIRTPLCDVLGIEHPIVLGGMMGISDAKLTAAVSNGGALGTLSSATFGVDGTRTELQSLTESQVFRFPSTFTFIFRAIASIDGIGKGLDEDYDLGEFAQPFVTKLIDKVKYGGDNSKKSLAVFGKATGLNAEDVNTALTQPRKIAYLEETMRSIEQGQLKIRVRSLENEMALTRLGTQSSGMTNLLLSSLVLNVGRE